MEKRCVFFWRNQGVEVMVVDGPVCASDFHALDVILGLCALEMLLGNKAFL